MAIIGTLPYTILAGQLISAAPVMGDYNYIQAQVNANAAPLNAPSITGPVIITGSLSVLTGPVSLAGGLTASGTISLTAGSIESNVVTPFEYRNRLINGDMRLDQRNEGATQTIVAAAAGAYTVDRWYATCTGANVTGARVAGSAPDQFVYQFTGAASVTGIAFGQRIEATNIYDLSSSTVAFQVKLANSLLTTVNWAAYYPTATDNYAGRTLITSGSFTVTSTLTRYTATVALPSNVTAGLSIEFSVGAQISGTWQIGDVSLEAGSNATPFGRLSIGQTLSMAQRFYEKSFAQGTAPAQNISVAPYNFSQNVAAGSPHRGQQITFKIPKRVAPSTTTTYNPGAANSSARNLQRSNDAAISNGSADVNGYSFTISASTGSIAGDQNQLHWSVDSEIY